jgi:hypothetical protein
MTLRVTRFIGFTARDFTPHTAAARIGEKALTCARVQHVPRATAGGSC